MQSMGELGTWLIRAREARGLTIEDAERDTRISRRYLQALESEQFEVIPAPVYARGFLRSYSQYLGLDPAEMLSLFPRDDDAPTPVIGGPRGASGNVGVAVPRPPSQVPTMKNPVSGQSAARPQWNKPSRSQGKEQPLPKRPQVRRPQPPQTQPDSPLAGTEYEIGGPLPAAREPMIGVDIGVPVPARKLNADPAAQSRNLAVLGVAAGVIILAVIVALVISKAGGGSGTPGAAPTSVSTIGVGTSRGDQPTAVAGTPATSTSGVSTAPGTVPRVEGLTVEKARLAIAEAGFKVREVAVAGCTGPKGQVTQQAPGPGEKLDAGLQVIISVCSGQ